MTQSSFFFSKSPVSSHGAHGLEKAGVRVAGGSSEGRRERNSGVDNLPGL